MTGGEQKYKGWTEWDLDECKKMIKHKDPEARLRAQYVMGTLNQLSGHYEEALNNFRQVISLDPHFCPSVVSLRMAEVCYRLH